MAPTSESRLEPTGRSQVIVVFRMRLEVNKFCHLIACLQLRHGPNMILKASSKAKPISIFRDTPYPNLAPSSSPNAVISLSPSLFPNAIPLPCLNTIITQPQLLPFFQTQVQRSSTFLFPDTAITPFFIPATSCITALFPYPSLFSTHLQPHPHLNPTFISTLTLTPLPSLNLTLSLT